ncbi:hypothetical protein [Candidatus Rickettsia colombianensi]|uniref:hypothetical protein n=1 Tax=Candidatus Rickettsia colombianensi TaxID=1090944 RepID=UPI0015ACBA21|nr:hypothetical protein [Candidatus Rickettsia colombianensi]
MLIIKVKQYEEEDIYQIIGKIIFNLQNSTNIDEKLILAGLISVGYNVFKLNIWSWY